MNDKLTIFYNKRLGTIKELCGGEQDMAFFGDEAEDYSHIFDYIVVDYDDYIMQNFINFEVVEGKLKLKPDNVPEKYL